MPSKEARDLTSQLLGGGMLSLEEENPQFGEQLEENRAISERVLQQRERAQTGAEIIGGIGGAAAAGPVLRRLGLKGARAVAARMAGGGLGSGTGAGMMPTQEGSRVGEMLEGFARGAAGELLGPAVRPVGRLVGRSKLIQKSVDKMRAPLRSHLIPQSDEVAEVFEGTGARPTPTQFVDQRLLDEFEAAIQASIFGGARVSGARRRAAETATGLIKRFTDDFRATHSAEETGRLISMAMENSGRLHQRAQRGAFSGLMRRYGHGEIEVSVLPKLAKHLEKQLTGLRSATGPARSVIKDVVGETKVDKAARETFPTEAITRVGRGEKVSLGEAINLRSDLLALERAAGDILPGRTQATAAGFARVLDRRIREGLRKQFGPEAVEAWRNANRLVASGKGPTGFNNQMMREIIDTAEPEHIVSKVIREKSPSRIRNVRTKVEAAIRKGKADPETWRAVQGEFLLDLLRDPRHTDPLTKQVNGEALLRTLTTYGDEALREVFPGGTHKQLELLTRALAFSQRPEKSGFGGVAMRLAQFSAIIQLAADPLETLGLIEAEGENVRDEAAGAILLGPIALSYVLTNPRSARYLTTGLKSPPGSATAKRAFQQLASHLDEIVPLGTAATNVPPMTPAPEAPHISDLRGGQ
jgi:hypothetical protein